MIQWREKSEKPNCVTKMLNILKLKFDRSFILSKESTFSVLATDIRALHTYFGHQLKCLAILIIYIKHQSTFNVKYCSTYSTNATTNIFIIRLS